MLTLPAEMRSGMLPPHVYLAAVRANKKGPMLPPLMLISLPSLALKNSSRLAAVDVDLGAVIGIEVTAYGAATGEIDLCSLTHDSPDSIIEGKESPGRSKTMSNSPRSSGPESNTCADAITGKRNKNSTMLKSCVAFISSPSFLGGRNVMNG